MAQQRLSMRKIREILRLYHEHGLSRRQIAASIGVSRSAVGECLRRAAAGGLAWPLPAGLDEAELQARLYPAPARPATYPLPDFAQVHAELARKGVTRWLLWQEYKAAQPAGLQYTAFCEHYRRWLADQDIVLRRVHVPGERLFVDYAGATVAITDRHTGAIRAAQIFVAVLGCSNYTFAKATWTQAVADWLASHVRALEFFGGAPGAIVPDNLKSAVVRAHRYEPDLNPAYQDFAEHYGVAILPARVRKPRDKAKVEGAVLIVERWILARLRHRTFFSLAEANAAIASLLAELNERPFKKLAGCRRSRFEALERPALKALPARPYAYAAWRKARVGADYHVEVERAYYSVPYALSRQAVEVRLTATTVEVFHRGRLVAAHPRAQGAGACLTLPAHRPPAHRTMLEADPALLVARAGAIGPATAEIVRAQARHKRHHEETLRSAQAILRLAQDFSAAELEAACVHALALHSYSYSYSYRVVRTLIRQTTSTPRVETAALPTHPNLRGADYFQ